MSVAHQSAVCQRCGRGFVFTQMYRDLLARRGIREKRAVLCVTCFKKWGPAPKTEGIVKWFSSRKRYGFITTEGDQDIFLHQEEILDDQELEPRKGQRTRFHVQDAPKGPEAVNVELL